MDEFEEVFNIIGSAEKRRFISGFEEIMALAHECAKNKGFWDKKNLAEKLLMVIGEIIEVTEAVHAGNPQSEYLPRFTQVETELADVIIRVMDLSQAYNLRLAEAVIAKMDHNLRQENEHGSQT